MKKISIIAAALLVTTAAVYTAVALVKNQTPKASSALPLTVYANQYPTIQRFMKGIYFADQGGDIPEAKKISIVVLPHHLTATDDIAVGVKSLTARRPRKILLISPDHFNRCPVLTCTSRSLYQTAFGPVGADADKVENIIKSEMAGVELELFKNEHGIHAVVPYIAHYLPAATVTPLVINQARNWKANRNQLLAITNSAIDDDTVAVFSSDFSHYLPLAEAEKMDDLTWATLAKQDLKEISNLKNPAQSDCPACLWSATALAKQKTFAPQPMILGHSNSADLLGDKTAQETTSHFAIIWK